VNKTTLIARHEFLITVRRKAFVIFTLAFPVLALLAMLASQVIAGMQKPPAEIENIGYVDETGVFSGYTEQGKIVLVRFTAQGDASEALLDKDIKEYFVIPPDYVDSGLVYRFTLDRELEPGGEVTAVIQDFLLSNLLEGKTTPEITERVKAPLNMVSTLLTDTGEVAPNQGGFANFIIPYIFSMLLLMSIFFSSGYLLQGLGEEKENRVMEILLSSLSSRQLLAGKVIGLGAAGLVQIIVWLVSAQFLAKFASNTWGNIIGNLQIPSDFLILGTIYFILGYLLFAVLMAGVGAVSPTAREGQQMSTLFTIAGIAPLWFMAFIIENPDHIVSQILTIFPITAPITVMIRLGLTKIPIWELAASIGLMIASIIGCFILAAKLFRTFLLMYGKRPEFKEIIHSFRNA
jgi:ABC-2 type transport system permease protein